MVTMAVAAVMMAAMSGCGGGSLQKSVKSALLNGDTTATSFAEICKIIKADTRTYADYIDENGEVNVEALDEMINTIGAGLRPARHWNVKAYGATTLSLSVYLERSGSMTPYDTQSGGGELKKAVNDLINFFPSQSGDPRIYIVNDGVYDYSGEVTAFLKDKNIYASTANIGNSAFTDFSEIFSKILSGQKLGDVSVLITDMIYSPRDTKNVSVEKIFNEESSLATSVFRQYPGKSVIVNKLRGSYHGPYYPYNAASYRYDGARPFYVFVIADSEVINTMMSGADYDHFINLAGTEQSYRFNQPESAVTAAVLPNWEGSKGRYRVTRGDELGIEKCEGDRVSGIVQFSVAVDFSALGKSDEFLCDAANYDVTSAGGYSISVAPIADGQVSGNNKSYLEGKTHVITIAGAPEVRRDEVIIKLKNAFPEWIAQSNAADDTSASAPNFAQTTFGIEPFLRGIYDAYTGSGDAYATLKIKVEK